MRLSPDSREFVHFDITMPLADSVPTTVSVNFGTAWNDLAFVSWEASTMTVAGDDVEALTSRWQILVAGPDGAGGGAIVLPLRRTHTRIQVNTGSEIIIRAGDPIDVA